MNAAGRPETNYFIGVDLSVYTYVLTERNLDWDGVGLDSGYLFKMA